MRSRIFLLILILVILPGSLHAQTPQGDDRYTTRMIQVEGEPVTLSPDGNWIAGIRDFETICIWDIANLHPHCVATGQQVSGRSLNWAPDSSAVAFSTGSLSVHSAPSDIFTFDASGVLHNLAHTGAAIATPVTGMVRIVDVFPVWSPDSTSIAFARSIVQVPASGDAVSDGISLMQMTRTGEHLRLVAMLTTDPSTVIAGPSFWLPDDTLVVSLQAPPRILEVHQIDARSGEMVRIVSEFERVVVRDISSDGERFSLTVLGQIGSQEVLLDAGSGEVTELAHYQPEPGVLIFGPLGFSPDGETVVYHAALGEELNPVVAIGLADPLLIPLEGVIRVESGDRVLDWAANNSILVPYKGASGDVAVLITLR